MPTLLHFEQRVASEAIARTIQEHNAADGSVSNAQGVHLDVLVRLQECAKRETSYSCSLAAYQECNQVSTRLFCRQATEVDKVFG
jgi:hypothetical protein